jgi:hypothetical protein
MAILTIVNVFAVLFFAVLLRYLPARRDDQGAYSAYLFSAGYVSSPNATNPITMLLSCEQPRYSLQFSLCAWHVGA